MPSCESGTSFAPVYFAAGFSVCTSADAPVWAGACSFFSFLFLAGLSASGVPGFIRIQLVIPLKFLQCFFRFRSKNPRAGFFFTFRHIAQLDELILELFYILSLHSFL